MDAAVAAVIRHATDRVPAFAARLAAAGVDEVTSAADLDRIPVFTKDDLIAAQRANPPFGGTVAPDAVVCKVFASPGPLYEPQLAGPDPWRWAEALRAAGIGADDTMLNCFSYHLSPAGAMFEEGGIAVGATVVPAGVGNQQLQVQLAAAVNASAYVGLPSYLKALIETAGSSELPFPVRRAVVTAEPLPDSLRAWLTEHVPIVHQAYGTAEAGLLGYETGPGSGLAVPAGVLVQVCDLSTGQPRVDDGVGQVVVTLLRPDQPLVRFGTGDLSAWTLGARGTLRLAGVLGRIGDAVKVRGVFLHPRQAAAALAREPDVTAHRFVIDRTDHRDTLRCEIVPALSADPQLPDRVHDLIRAYLRLSADIVCVPSLPDGPAIHDQRTWS
ncbi:CoF synthetase [Actinoplanes sp. ATCC 53533]|nr:CoF synthetase [Actinoplanes sp. ATCC 53533]